MRNPIPSKPLATTPNPFLLMFKMLRLLPLPPARLLRSMLFNPPPPVKTNPEKERVRISRTKILHKQKEPKLHLLTIGISANLDALALSVVMITTRRIVHDVPRSLSSFKEPRNHLHRLSCTNPSHLNNRLSWSSMTNLHLLPPLMF